MTTLARSPEFQTPDASSEVVDPSAFIDPRRPGSWSRQMNALANAGHYREAYELVASKWPYIENQLQYFARCLAGQENQWSIVHRRLADILDQGRPLRILDVGCAVGCHAIQFALDGHQARGIDILPAMIRRGRELIESLELSQRVQLVDGDVRRLDTHFEPGSFDCAVASDIFEHLEDEAILDVLAALRRVLRPGGRVAIQTSPGRFYYWFEPDRTKLLALLVPFAWLPDRLFSAYVRGLDRFIFQGLRHEPLHFYRHEAGHINCMDPIHLRHLLVRAGLKNVRTYAVHAHPGFKDEGCLRRAWLKSLFGRKSIACRNVFGIATV